MSEWTPPPATEAETEALETIGKSGDRRHPAGVAKVMIGQEDVIEQLLIAILARGHCLLKGCRASPRP